MTTKIEVIAPSKFAHFVLRTGQKAVLRDWYRTVLGARVQHEDEMLCFLTYDDEHHRIALAQIPGLEPAAGATAGLDHTAYSYRGLGELLDTYERLKAEGITPWWPVNHGVTTSLYYRDPDGNGVELQVDNFATADECNAFIQGDAFRQNPVGVNFDPDEMLARFRSGVPAEELTKYDG